MNILDKFKDQDLQKLELMQIYHLYETKVQTQN